jgi:phosphoenolpyruvate carboxykinase (ATP)
MVGRHQQSEFEQNQFLGKELQHLSKAGFDLDRIHIKVSVFAVATMAPLTF